MDELIKLLDPNLMYISHNIDGDTINIHVESIREDSICPYCDEPSIKVHSRYERKFQDLPIQDKKVRIILNNRKYFCYNENCKHKTFAESFAFFKPKATKTIRLQDKILEVSISQSSISASKYLRRNVANVSKSTICNLLKKRRADNG